MKIVILICALCVGVYAGELANIGQIAINDTQDSQQDTQYAGRGKNKSATKSTTKSTSKKSTAKKSSKDSSKEGIESSDEYWSDEELNVINNASKNRVQKRKKKAKAVENDFAKRKHQFYFSIGAGTEINGSDIGTMLASVSLGYAWLFNENIGIRPYVNAGASLITQNYWDYSSYYGSTYQTGLIPNISASINLDVIGSFYTSKSGYFSAGYAAGLGFAGVVTTDVYTDNANDLVSYGLRANLGLKVVWLKKHGIELMCRIPIAISNKNVSVTLSYAKTF